MHVCLITTVLPWMFGPYAAQMSIVAHAMIDAGHRVFWIAAAHDMEERTFTVDEYVAASNVPSRPAEAGATKLARRLTFLGHRRAARGKNTVSSFNRLLRRHDIDAVIFLMDVDKLDADAMWDVARAIAWYPNHFTSLDHQLRSSLATFSDVASLCPTDAAMLAAALPHVRVTLVPHVVEVPHALRGQPDVAALRRKYGVDADAFVVLVSCGNYDFENRKALDVSLQAFQQLRAKVPRAFLYLKVISVREILRAESKDAQHASGPELPLRFMLDTLGLDPASYAINERILPAMSSWELMAMSNVLLHPSKTEGFGMPVLEAQALGTPVVTTRFGAMADFTMHGYSVPHAGLTWFVRGFAAAPHVPGVAEALVSIAHGDLDGSANRTAAVEAIAANMSREAVTSALRSLLPTAAECAAAADLSGGGDAPPPPPGALDDDGEAAAPATGSLFEPPQRRGVAAGIGLVTYESGWVRPPSHSARWTLVQSELFEESDAAALERAMHQVLRAPVDLEVLILLSREPSGAVMPRAEDLSQGKVSTTMAVLIRTSILDSHYKRPKRRAKAPRRTHAAEGTADLVADALRNALRDMALRQRKVSIYEQEVTFVARRRHSGHSHHYEKRDEL